MKRLLLILVLSIPILLLDACKKTVQPVADYIPSDAFFVAGADLDLLSEKADFDQMKDNLMFRIMGAMLESKDIPNFLEDRTVTGIDFSRQAFLAMMPAEGEMAVQPVAFIPVEDASVMKDFLKKVTGHESFEPAGSYDILQYENMVIGLDSRICILAMGPDSLNHPGINRYFSLEKEQTLASSNEAFRNLIGELHDISLWMDFSGLNPQDLAEKSGMPPETFAWLDFSSSVSVDFKDGYVHGHSVTMGGEHSGEWMDRLIREDFDDELFAYLPDQHPAVIFRGSFNLPAYLELLGQSPVLDSMEANGPFTRVEFDSLLSLFTGDVMLAVTGPPAPDKSNNRLFNLPSVVIAAGIHDSTGFFTKLHRWVADTADGEFTRDSLPEGLLLRADALVFVTDPTLRAAMSAEDYSPAGSLDPELRKQLTGFPVAGVVDFGTLVRMMEEAPGSTGMVTGGFDKLDRFIVQQTAPENGRIEADFYLYLKDRDVNSLKGLLQAMMNTVNMPF